MLLIVATNKYFHKKQNCYEQDSCWILKESPAEVITTIVMTVSPFSPVHVSIGEGSSSNNFFSSLQILKIE